MCRKLFFSSSSLPTFSSGQLTEGFQLALCKPEKICFSFKIKEKQRLIKLVSETLLVCHSAVTSTKWRNMKATPTSFWKIFKWNLLGEAYYKAIYDLRYKATQTGFSTDCNTALQESFLKSHFSSFVIIQCGNSGKLRWVNSTLLNKKFWLVLISYVVFMLTLLAFVYQIFITFWSVGNWR